VNTVEKLQRVDTAMIGRHRSASADEVHGFTSTPLAATPSPVRWRLTTCLRCATLGPLLKKPEFAGARSFKASRTVPIGTASQPTTGVCPLAGCPLPSGWVRIVEGNFGRSLPAATGAPR
jgi:hypothetical protein